MDADRSADLGLARDARRLARKRRVTRLGSAHHELATELVSLCDSTPDEGIAPLVAALVALRDAPLPDGLAHTLARRAPAFVLAYARACDFADEMEGL